MTITKLQEIYFDICDLIDSGQIDDFRLRNFQEFWTLREFLVEQKEKLERIEAELDEETMPTDEGRSYGPHFNGRV
jgi:hypothetical protein